MHWYRRFSRSHHFFDRSRDISKWMVRCAVNRRLYLKRFCLYAAERGVSNNTRLLRYCAA
jgi:hypothetical protein